MVKLCENSDRAFEQVRRARFVRRRPYETQRVAPNVALLLIRARYYDPLTGEFTSRDPLEYLDGMSLYRGYFVPGGVDPFGKQETTATWGAGITNAGEKNSDYLYNDEIWIAGFHGWLAGFWTANPLPLVVDPSIPSVAQFRFNVSVSEHGLSDAS